GSSVEFADYRDYHAGDDFRFIDWNIYARLDRLFLKTFVEEENAYIHILMDLSSSMSFGIPSKLEYGKKICAALAYIGLADLDMVAMATFSEDMVGQILPTRGKDKIFNFLDFLEKAQVSQSTDMSYCFKKYAFNVGHPGVMIIISDFLVPPSDYEEGLKTLIYRNYDVNVIHVLSQEEIDPPLFGELRLQDSENGEIKEISITYGALEKYKERLKKFCYQLDSFCTKNNVTYLKISTDIPFEEFLLRILRRERMVV
ncbi:DUF58 domain-containing protein, partial [Candidatus Poribacteria bacterium]|nr:DUF58 domain-containing protein [Candidatus Poribacteria bacterium]